MSKEMKTFKIIVTHSLGFFSDYEIEAENYHDAEREAKKIFINQFCGGGDLTTTFRGVKEQHILEAFTINKYQHESIN